jgi:hypothetical protein
MVMNTKDLIRILMKVLGLNININMEIIQGEFGYLLVVIGSREVLYEGSYEGCKQKLNSYGCNS